MSRHARHVTSRHVTHVTSRTSRHVTHVMSRMSRHVTSRTSRHVMSHHACHVTHVTSRHVTHITSCHAHHVTYVTSRHARHITYVTHVTSRHTRHITHVTSRTSRHVTHVTSRTSRHVTHVTSRHVTVTQTQPCSSLFFLFQTSKENRENLGEKCVPTATEETKERKQVVWIFHQDSRQQHQSCSRSGRLARSDAALTRQAFNKISIFIAPSHEVDPWLIPFRVVNDRGILEL